MSTPSVSVGEVAAGLRLWAKGSYAEEAAVELLVRSFGGRLAAMGWPWVRRCGRPGWFWLDTEAIWTDAGVLSGGERRLLSIVAALAGGQPVPDLGGALAGLDRAHLELVLAAFAHAAGSHEQSVMRFGRDETPVFAGPGPLVGWPEEPAGLDGAA